MTDTVKTVNRFEGRLLALLYAITRLRPVEPAKPILFDRLNAPAGLSMACLDLIRDGLAKGCVHYLAKVGGWRNERFLSNGVAVGGRLWSRVPLEQRKLTFSRHVVDFLIWLTAHHPAHAKPWLPTEQELTPADQLMIFLAYDAFRDSEAGLAWRTRAVFSANPLIRLMWPEDFPGQTLHAPSYSGWGVDLGSAILESLQEPLAARWLDAECGKRDIADWQAMDNLAASQDLILERFLAAIDARRDLARFLLHASVSYCVAGVAASDLIGGVKHRGARLAERYAVQLRAAVLPRVLERLAMWAREARNVGYHDEGYSAAQFFLTQWEAAGADHALPHARRLLRELQPLPLANQEQTDEPSLSSPGERDATPSAPGG